MNLVCGCSEKTWLPLLLHSPFPDCRNGKTLNGLSLLPGVVVPQGGTWAAVSGNFHCEEEEGRGAGTLVFVLPVRVCSELGTAGSPLGAVGQGL